MKIVSKIKRRNGHTVDLGGVFYKFEPPSYVADVTEKAHVERFLSIPEGYGLAELDEEEAPTGVQQPEQAADPVVYVLSDAHPATFDINGTEYEQTDIVRRAAGDLTAEQWNALHEGDRADMIDAVLDQLAGDKQDDQPEDESAPLEGDLNGDGELDREELAKQYEAKFGKRPHGKWNSDKIREALGAAE